MTDISIKTGTNFLFDSPRWSDTTIHVWDPINRGVVHFHAHRAILATHSEIFKQCLLGKSDVIEHPTVNIREDWCNARLFRAVLWWMYTQSIYVANIPALDGASPDTYLLQNKILQQLQKVAREFEILGLVDACEVEIKKFVENLTDAGFLSRSILEK